MDNFDALVTITLDSRTLRYSFHGVTTETAYYDGRLASVSDIDRRADPNGGVFQHQSATVAIADADRTLRKLRQSESFQNRSITIDLINLDTGDTTTVFTGRIVDIESNAEELIITARDVFSEKFMREIPLKITPDLFPNMPDTTPTAMIPIVFGEVLTSDYSDVGAVPAYIIDPAVGSASYKCIAAQQEMDQITDVFVNGVKLASAQWSSVTDSVSTEFGSMTMQFILLDFDPRDGKDGNPVISWSGKSTASTADRLAPNIVEDLLTLHGLFSSSDLDSAMQSSAATDYDDLSLYCDLAITEPMTYFDFFDLLARTLNLATFQTAAGKIGMFFDNAGAGTSKHDYRDDENIIRWGSTKSPDKRLTRINASYARNYAFGRYDAWTYHEDSTEKANLNNETIIVDLSLDAIRNINRAKQIAEIKLYQNRSDRQVIEFDAEFNPDLELGDRADVTHFAGESTDDIGINDDPFRIYGSRISVDKDFIHHQLMLVDNPGLSHSTFSEPEPSRQALTFGDNEIIHDIVFTVTDNRTIRWSAGTIYLRRIGKTYGIGTGSYAHSGTCWIYFDPDASINSLQAATNISDLVGPRKYILRKFVYNSDTNQYGSAHDPSGDNWTNSDYISPKTISTNHLQANCVETDQLTANAITSKHTITAAVYQTGTSGERVVINPTSFKIYNSADDETISLWGESIKLGCDYSARQGYFYFGDYVEFMTFYTGILGYKNTYLEPRSAYDDAMHLMIGDTSRQVWQSIVMTAGSTGIVLRGLNTTNYPFLRLGPSGSLYSRLGLAWGAYESYFQAENDSLSAVAYDTLTMKWTSSEITQYVNILPSTANARNIGNIDYYYASIWSALFRTAARTANPSPSTGFAIIFYNSTAGELRVVFPDGTVRTLATN